MPLVLCRVDDRLIHGQVVLGWARPLDVNRIVLIDDSVAANDWEQDLYRMAMPEGVELVFASTDMARRQLPDWTRDEARTLLVTGEIDVIAALADGSPAGITAINLGGIHHRPGRRERLPYIYLTDAELVTLRQLSARGVVVTAQDVPRSAAIDLAALA